MTERGHLRHVATTFKGRTMGLCRRAGSRWASVPAAILVVALLASLVAGSAGLGATVRPVPRPATGSMDLGSGCGGPVTSHPSSGPRPTLPPGPMASPRTRPTAPPTPVPTSTATAEASADPDLVVEVPSPSATDHVDVPSATPTSSDPLAPDPKPTTPADVEPTSSDAPVREPEPDSTPTEPPDRTPGPTERPDPTQPPADQSTPAPDEGGPATDTPAEANAVAGLAAIALEPIQSAAPSGRPLASPSPSPVIEPLSTLGRMRLLLLDVLDLYLRLVAYAMPPVAEPEDPARDTDPPPPARLPFVPPPRYGSIGETVAGIDVSHWNGVVPFDLVRGSGAGFVLMKATQGTTFVDPAYQRHLVAARDAGLLVGPYHFYDYRVGGRAQADHFIDTVAAGAGVRGSLPFVVDIECFAPFGAADQDFVRVELRAFVGRVFERTGRLPMIYTSWYMWRAVTGGDPSFGDVPLWVACWRCGRPALPSGWSDWDFWQVGSIVISASGNRLGSDLFDGDLADLRRLARGGRAAR